LRGSTAARANGAFDFYIQPERFTIDLAAPARMQLP
jgi:hypothetical protein